YPAHAWSPEGDRVVVATDTGDILVIEGTELKMTLSSGLEGAALHCMVHYQKGFAVGADNGTVVLFDREADDKLYRKGRSVVAVGQPHAIRSIACSPSEESLGNESAFEIVAQPFHSGDCADIDTCIRKPLAVSCSSDHSIRIWNHHERSVELVKTFAEDLMSVALHPAGHMLLAGCIDKLRLLTITMDSLKSVKEIAIKGCRECCFSSGGHLFAAVNGTTVSIYNTWTCENIGNLRGHNGRVRSVIWSPDDQRLVTAGADGAVYEWRLQDFKREKENVLKGCNYGCVAATPDGKELFAVGSDKKLKQFEDSEGAGTQMVKEYDTKILVTQICLPAGGRVLFAGTETGCIRAYKYPLTGEYQEYRCCSSSITRLRLSHDDGLLFVSSEDGSLFVFEVKDRDPARTTTKRDGERMPWSEEVLVGKADVEENRHHIIDLETQVNELRTQNEYQLRLKDMAQNEKIREMNEKYAAEMDASKMKLEGFIQEKNDQEMEYEEKLRSGREDALAQAAAAEAQYQTRIMAELERYAELSREKDLLNERWDEQHTVLVESHERVVQEITQEYEIRIHEEQLRMNTVEGEKEAANQESSEVLHQQEEDADQEIEEMRDKYEAKLTAERDMGLRLKGENGIMKKRFSALQKDIDEAREECKALFDQKKELYQTIAGLEKDILGHKKELLERDETIRDKEKRIYDLKKKNQELEKFKFVLDYKIRELKRQAEPKDDQISDMRDTIKEMEAEIARFHKNNAALDLTLSEYRLKENGLQKEILRQRHSMSDGEQVIKHFQNDLTETAQHIQDPHKLKEAVVLLLQRHGGTGGGPSLLAQDVQAEFDRQREFLERTIATLRKKTVVESEQHRAGYVRIRQENMALVRELNQLRRELRSARDGGPQSSLIPALSPKTGVSSNQLSQPSSPSNPKALAVAKKRSPSGQRITSPAHWKQAGLMVVSDAEGGAASPPKAEVEALKSRLLTLQQQLQEKDERIEMMETQLLPRPVSRGQLPPMAPIPKIPLPTQ
ncbi:hypothetical protein WJX84_006234, partial [Apatococcus fuscideae]